MDDARTPLHVVVLPWLAFGHLLPFLELSKALARRGHRVSFVSTPRNLQRLPALPPTLSRLITPVELPFPSGTPLPPGAEATSDIHPADNGHLKAAYDALEAPFAAFLDSVFPTPDWVVHDYAACWMPRVAGPRLLPCAFFSVVPPSTMAFWGPPAELLGNLPSSGRFRKKPEDLTVPPPWIEATQHSTLAYHLHEARDFFPNFQENASGFSEAQRMGSTLETVHLVIMRSCPEFDGYWLRLLGEIYNKPVVPAGFLRPSVKEKDGEAAATAATASSDSDIFHWLDSQPSGSVLFVALGSEAVLSVDLFHELAFGLDLSRLPFLWALRRPAGISPDVDLLPEGFEARTAGRGLVVVKGWVPQPEVLAHAAVGGFLTHSGWSSMVEGLSCGRPMVMLPVFGDQGINARRMEAIGVGREVPRGGDDGAFTRDGLAETARLVVVDAAGEGVRAAARRAMEIFGDESTQEKHVDGLAQYLLDHRDVRYPHRVTVVSDSLTPHHQLPSII